MLKDFDEQEMDFFTGVIGVIGQKWQFKVENVLMMDFFLTTWRASLCKMLTDWLESCGMRVDYCDAFISCLDSHSDGTHSNSSGYSWLLAVIWSCHVVS